MRAIGNYVRIGFVGPIHAYKKEARIVFYEPISSLC